MIQFCSSPYSSTANMVTLQNGTPNGSVYCRHFRISVSHYGIAFSTRAFFLFPSRSKQNESVQGRDGPPLQRQQRGKQKSTHQTKVHQSSITSFIHFQLNFRLRNRAITMTVPPCSLFAGRPFQFAPCWLRYVAHSVAEYRWSTTAEVERGTERDHDWHHDSYGLGIGATQIRCTVTECTLVLPFARYSVWCCYRALSFTHTHIHTLTGMKGN